MANHTSIYPSQQMDTLFSALADPTRRDILERLTITDLTVSEIAKPYTYALPTISKHISVLVRAQLVHKKKVGREHRVYFEPRAMRTVAEYISFYKRFWTSQIDSLEKFLASR